MDNMSQQQRSVTMSRIRARDTRPECRLRSALFKLGYRYRKNVGRLPGNPDIILSKFNAALFVNGCFWHHHDGCSRATIPNSNKSYWQQKLTSNAARDIANSQMLETMGWRVMTIWECEINYDLDATLAKVVRFLDTPDD